MSEVSNDDSVKERSHTSENKLHLDPEGSQSSLQNLEKVSVKNVMESDRGTMKINANELIPAEGDLLKNEMDLSQSENIHSVETESGKALDNVDLYNDNKLNNSRKLTVDKANVNSDIADASLKGISTKDYDKADKRQRKVDNRESETHGNQSADANIYRDNFCIVNGSQEIGEIYDSIRSCVDAILDNVCLTEKENELVNIDFIVKNKEKLEALSQELSLLNRSPVKSQVKKENNCDIFEASDVLSSEEKSQNFIKPLNTEINKSGKQNMDACCNSEKDNFQSMIVDIVMKAILIDNGKSGGRGILEPETQEHENSEANVKGENNSFVSDYKGVAEINDDVAPCVDMVLENLSLTKEKTDLNDYFVVSNRETPEEISHKLRKLDKSLQKDQMKGDNCDTFGLKYVISSEEKQENFIEPLNTEINKQNIHECCNLEKDNCHSMNVDIVLKDISEDNGRAGKRGITELETQEHENREDNIGSGDSCFIKIYKEVTDINDDVKSCVDTILENLSSTKENVELINDNFVVSNSEKSQEISQELSKLGRSLKEDQIKGDNDDAIGANHGISSEEKQENLIEPLNTKIKNSGKPNIYECCNLEKDNLHAMNVDIVMKDISEDKGEADRRSVTESEIQEHENRENNINSGDNCFINAYKEVIEINDDVKSCVDMILENLSLTEEKVELINDNFAVSNGEKSEEISQQLGKLVISPQENQMKANNCDAYGVILTISSQENFTKPLNTEINNSDKEDLYACYSENGNFHSMDGDVVMTDISEDNGREVKRDTAADITNPEGQEHEKGAANVNSVDNCFINKYKEVAEINGDVRSCADKILQNLNLTEKDTEIIHDFTVSSKELMEEDRQELSKLGRSFQKTEMKGGNICDINSDVKCKLLDTEINSYSIDINLKDISTKDFEKGNLTESGIDGSEIEAHEQHNTEDNIYSGKSNVIISNGGVGGKSDAIKLSDPLLEIPSLTENGSERNNIDLVISNSETSEKNSQELNKLGRSLQDDQVKVHSCDLFGVNHDINSGLSFSKPLDAESNDSHVQSIDSYSYSEKDFNSDSFKYIIRNDCRKADHINRGTDNVETEVHKQDIEVSIYSGKSSVINSNRRVSEKSDDIKLSDPLLGIATLAENASKSINVDFNANDNEKLEKITQESKLGKNISKDQMKENNCDANSDINFSKRLDTEITDSHAQGIDLYSNNSENDKCNLDSIDVSFGDLSTKDCRKADHISRAIDNAETETFEQQNIEDRICCSKSSVIKNYERVGGTSDDTKSSLPLIEIASLTENENELIHVGFIANSEKTEAVCQELNMLCGSTQKDETKMDNCITLGLNHANSPEEKPKDLDNVFDTDTNNLCKQNTVVCNNPEKENSDSVVDVNLKTTSLKDQGRPSQSDNNNGNAACETLKHQRTKASTCSSIVDRVGEITPLESKSTTVPEDSEVIIIFDNGNEHFDYEILDENSNDLIGKKNNINVQSQEKFNEELDNKLEILKAQYSDIESALVTASESFSLETVYKFIAKIKKELTSCVQSSEKLRIRFRNKWLSTKSETSNEKNTPSCSYKQPEEPFKTPFDKYRYRSQACTKLHTTISNNNRLYRKIESHHFVEYNSPMFPRETVQTSHRCRQSPEHFSSSENEPCNNLHKKKCKSSHYSYERKSQRFNEDKGLEKCSLSKNSSYSTETTGGRSVRDTKKHGCSKMGCYARVGGFSKSSFVHKELKSPRNYIPYSSHSNPVPRLSSPNENYSILKPHCSRKKVSEVRKQKDFKSPKYGREYDFNSDSSDSLQFSSDSDRESAEIHSDHYYGPDKYYNRAPKWIKKEKVSSGSRKRKYKRDGYSTSNSDSSVQEVEAPFAKRHDKQVAYEWDTENRRVQGLINRQMDFINKHVSRKDDLVKFQESALIPSNIAEKDKRQKYYNKKKFSDDEISSANDMPSIYENQKKRKKNVSEAMATPYKLAKTSNCTDVHSFLKNKYSSPSSDAKLRSSVVAPSPHSPVLSEESDRRASYKQAKTRNRVDEDIFENTSKYNIKSSKAQFQNSVVSPSRILISPVKSNRRRNDKEIDSLSLKTLRDPVQEYSEIKMSNLDNRRRGKIWNDAVQECRNLDDQEWSENEINNVKDMQSYVSFLKKKKGSYTNIELLLKDPMDDILPKSVTNDEPYVDTHRENKHKAGCNKEVGSKTKLMQKSPEKDLMYPENSSGKMKKTVRVPKIYSEMSDDERPGKGKPMHLTQMSNSKKKPLRLPRMSSEVIEQSEIERPTKKKHVRISPFSSEMAEQSFIEKPKQKKSSRISPVSSEIKSEQSFIEKPAKKKPFRISPISWEVPEKSLIQKPTMKKPVCIPQISSKVTKSFIEEPAMKKPACIPQITSKVTEKRSTQKPAKKKPVEDKKDSPVFNRSLDLFKQLNREIGKKKVTKHTPVSSKASAHDVYSKYQD